MGSTQRNEIVAGVLFVIATPASLVGAELRPESHSQRLPGWGYRPSASEGLRSQPGESLTFGGRGSVPKWLWGRTTGAVLRPSG